MMRKAVVVTAAAVIGLLAVVASVTLQPTAVRAQENGPTFRIVQVAIIPSEPNKIPKAHFGNYRISGARSEIQKPALVVEQDAVTALGNGGGAFKLEVGNYEIHIQPDNSYPMIKRFIVDNLAGSAILLRFDVKPEADPAARKKLELIRIGTSLAEIEARIEALAKQTATNTEAIAELQKKTSR